MKTVENTLKLVLRVGDARPWEALEAYISRLSGFTRSLVAKAFRNCGVKRKYQSTAILRMVQLSRKIWFVVGVEKKYKQILF